MPHFPCYRLVDNFGLAARGDDDDFGRFVDSEGHDPSPIGPQSEKGFSAILYSWRTPLHSPPWSSFMKDGFISELHIPAVAAVGALLVVRIEPEQKYFAFSFGSTGRFLLREGSWRRGYGLKAAINLTVARELKSRGFQVACQRIPDGT